MSLTADRSGRTRRAGLVVVACAVGAFLSTAWLGPDRQKTRRSASHRPERVAQLANDQTEAVEASVAPQPVDRAPEPSSELLAVRVLAPSGEPFSHAAVSWDDAGGERHGTTTDTDGVAEIAFSESATNTPVHVSAWGPGLLPDGSQVAPGSRLVSLQLRVAPRKRLQLRWAGGDVAGGVAVRAQALSHDTRVFKSPRLFRAGGAAGFDSGVTDSDGYVELSPGAGPWRLWLDGGWIFADRGRHGTSRVLEANAWDDQLELSVVRRGYAVVRARAAGQPLGVAPRRVQIHRAKPAPDWHKANCGDGRFAFPVVVRSARERISLSIGWFDENQLTSVAAQWRPDASFDDSVPVLEVAAPPMGRVLFVTDSGGGLDRVAVGLRSETAEAANKSAVAIRKPTGFEARVPAGRYLSAALRLAGGRYCDAKSFFVTAGGLAEVDARARVDDRIRLEIRVVDEAGARVRNASVRVLRWGTEICLWANDVEDPAWPVTARVSAAQLFSEEEQETALLVIVSEPSFQAKAVRVLVSRALRLPTISVVLKRGEP